MAAPIEAANNILASGKYRAALAVIKGLRNGAVYGAKVRAPHALVMTFLFKSGPLNEKIQSILEATYTHSRNLACFVFSYKALTSMLKWLQSEKHQYHSFLAAFLTGYFVFGQYNKVNEQINLYLLSRIVYGLVKLAVDKGYVSKPVKEPFPLFAAVVWGTVLWLFEHHQNTLQPSLKSSMNYLYKDSNTFDNLRNFIIYNK